MKRKYIKDGNPALFSFFTDQTYARFSPSMKERWTLAEDTEYSEIPGEVLNVQDFTKKIHVVPPEITAKIEKPVETEPIDVPEQSKDIAWYKEELKRLGIKFSHNSKLETLKRKLDAYNPEPEE